MKNCYNFPGFPVDNAVMNESAKYIDGEEKKEDDIIISNENINTI